MTMSRPPKGLACPKCHPESMREETFEGITINRCKSCKGVFLDQGELEALLKENLGSSADTLGFTATSDVMDALPAKCPRCDKAMEGGTGAEGIRIDRCTGCHAVFLEQGELASLQLLRH
jgi:Zn-finger nucleic acid-binding protein